MRKRNVFIDVLIVFLIAIIISLIIYGKFFSLNKNVDYSLENGTLKIKYNRDNFLKNGTLDRISDDEGLKTTNSEIIYVYNSDNSTKRLVYSLTVGYDMDYVKENNISTDSLISLDYIKFIIYKYNQSTGSSVALTDVLSFGDLPVYSVDPSNSYNDQYLVYLSSIGNSSIGSSSETFVIKAWLDENTPASELAKLGYINLFINSEEVSYLSKYNLSGKVVDASGNPLENAKLTLLNNSFVVTSDANGGFTISDIWPYTYTLVINYNSKNYYANLNIKTGNANSVSSRVVPEYTISSKEQYMKDYFVTANQLKNNNYAVYDISLKEDQSNLQFVLNDENMTINITN